VTSLTAIGTKKDHFHFSENKKAAFLYHFPFHLPNKVPFGIINYELKTTTL
jgi:hypothetical protein